MLYTRSFPVVHGASRSRGVSNRIGIDFVEDCATYGFPLNVPTVTLSGTVVPTTGSPQDPPTGLPSSFFNGISSAATTTSPKASGPTSSTTGSAGGKSGAVRVGIQAEVICVLFSVWLTAVLVG